MQVFGISPFLYTIYRAKFTNYDTRCKRKKKKDAVLKNAGILLTAGLIATEKSMTTVYLSQFI